MKQTLELDLSKGVTKEKLAAFAAAVPDGVEIITDISHIPKDRPYESDKTTIALYAAWTV